MTSIPISGKSFQTFLMATLHALQWSFYSKCLVLHFGQALQRVNISVTIALVYVR